MLNRRPMVRAAILVALSGALTVGGCTSHAGSSSPGSLTITVTGLPTGVGAGVSVTGPNGLRTGVVGTTTLTGLASGTYIIQVTSVVSGDDAYAPSVLSEHVTVSQGGTATFAVTYAAVPATLQLIVTGLPAGVPASITVTGPNGFTSSASQSATLTAIKPGQYTITAASAIPAGVLYQPTPGTLVVTIAPGGQGIARVQYSHPESSLTLTIDGAYITQGAQVYSGGVSLVADRPGMLRVFLKASEANSAAPDVRVRFYSGTTLSATYLIHPTTPSVPLAIVEGDGTKSWNLQLPEHLIQPDLKMLIDVDPAGNVPLATRANLSFPASGDPAPLDVLAGIVYKITLVPVFNPADGTLGDVSAAGIGDFTNSLKILHPVWAFNPTVHAPFTFTGGALQSNDGNLAWQTLLPQIELLRQAESSPNYYYGVVKLTYSSGLVGLGYVGQERYTQYQSAIGWDSRVLNGQVGTAAGATYAHELGHNLSLQHAPCGGPANPDPSYPFVGGTVGRTGYNVITGALVPSTSFDVMSYCAPIWISDYSYRKMLTYLGATRGVLRAPATPGRAVILSGTLRAGQAHLNPALEVVAVPVLPAASGAYWLEGRATDGHLVFGFAFDPARVADATVADLTQFVFTVPVPDGVQLGQVRLVGPSIDTAISSSSASGLRSGGGDAVTAERLDAARVRVRWSTALYPMVMVRDAATGDVLAFGRSGDVVVRSGSAALDITASDGVKSTMLRLTP